MFSAGQGAAGLGVVFPAMRNGTEDFGLEAGADDSFFLVSAEEPVWLLALGGSLTAAITPGKFCFNLSLPMRLLAVVMLH